MTAQARLWTPIVLVASLALGLAAPAYAETVLITPSVTAMLGDTVRCRIVNVGTRAITMGVELLAPSGGAFLADDVVVVQAGTVGSRGMVVVDAAIDAHCRFVGNFNKALVRASIDIHAGATARTAVVAPAQ